MNQLSYYYLIVRYPGLRQFTNACYLRNEIDKLYDLLMGLETQDQPQGYYHA